MDNFYSTKEWIKLRSKAKAIWKIRALPCGYCDGYIDYGVHKVIVDHVLNRKKHPDRALDLSNLQVVHHECNTKKYAYVENNKRPEIGADGFPTNSDWS